MQEIMNFFIVLVVDVCVACCISSLYALGLRLWAKGIVDSQGNAHLMPRIASVVCFTACVVIVLFALWLIIPIFHS